MSNFRQFTCYQQTKSGTTMNLNYFQFFFTNHFIGGGFLSLGLDLLRDSGCTPGKKVPLFLAIRSHFSITIIIALLLLSLNINCGEAVFLGGVYNFFLVVRSKLYKQNFRQLFPIRAACRQYTLGGAGKHQHR